jgi:acetoin utilization deacetylase AcuC-like enzyme
MHEYPLYPGTGWIDETGTGPGAGTTINFPFPAGTTGDAYLTALDEVLVPAAERFDPTWLVTSAGFDGHRRDPLTGLGLSAGDFADFTSRTTPLVPAGRRLFVLEGGYDLEALAASAGACVASLAGARYRPESATSGGPGRATVSAARRLQEPFGG